MKQRKKVSRSRSKRRSNLDMGVFHGIPQTKVRALRSKFVRDCLAEGIQFPEQIVLVMNDVSRGITKDAVAGFKAAEARGE